jgi:hypothetical protein
VKPAWNEIIRTDSVGTTSTSEIGTISDPITVGIPFFIKVTGGVPYSQFSYTASTPPIAAISSGTQILNAYADMVFYIINDRLNNKLKKPLRFGWNYYNQSSNGTWHTDQNLDKYISFVYSLNTCDGGTEIKINNESKFYKSIGGDALMFPSNVLHRGTKPKKNRSRFNLNVVCEI